MRGTSNFLNRFLSILSARLLTTVLAILSTPIIVRLLGPRGYGDYAVMLSIFLLYMIPVSGSITEGVQKYVAERRDAAGWRAKVIRFYGLLGGTIVLAAAVILLVVTSLGVTESLFGAEFVQYFYLLAGLVLASQYRALTYHTVLGFGLEHVSGALDVTRKLLIVTVGIALVLAGFGVSGMLVGHIAANVALGLVGTVVIVRRISPREFLASVGDSFPRRELLTFNAMNIVLVLLIMSLYHVDVIMLRVLVGAETTGFYKAALALAEYLWAVPVALETVLLHSTSTLWSEGRGDEITKIASRITRYATLLVVLLALGLAALADSLVPLYYGDAFSVATEPLLLLLPGAVGFAVARPLRAIGQGSGRVRTVVYATGGAAAINVVLNVLLIPTYGMHGAAVATSVGYGSMFAFLVWAAWRIGYDPLEDFRGVRIAASALLSAPVIVFAARSIEGDVASLLVVPPLGLLVYTGLALLTGAIDLAEIRDLLAKAPDPVGSTVENALSGSG